MITPARLREAARAVRVAYIMAAKAKHQYTIAAAILGDDVADYLDAQIMEDLEHLPKSLVDQAIELDHAAVVYECARPETTRAQPPTGCPRCADSGVTHHDDRPEACDCPAGVAEEERAIGGGAS